MSAEEKLIEVEHENLMLSRELIEMYKSRIAELEIENAALKNQLVARPISLEQPKFPRPKIRTSNELIRALEFRSIPKVVAK